MNKSGKRTGVDQAYRFIHKLLDENTGGELLFLLAGRDPLPQWNEPTLGTTTLKPDRSRSGNRSTLLLPTTFLLERDLHFMTGGLHAADP